MAPRLGSVQAAIRGGLSESRWPWLGWYTSIQEREGQRRKGVREKEGKKGRETGTCSSGGSAQRGGRQRCTVEEVLVALVAGNVADEEA